MGWPKELEEETPWPPPALLMPLLLVKPEAKARGPGGVGGGGWGGGEVGRRAGGRAGERPALGTARREGVQSG